MPLHKDFVLVAIHKKFKNEVLKPYLAQQKPRMPISTLIETAVGAAIDSDKAILKQIEKESKYPKLIHIMGDSIPGSVFKSRGNSE